MALRVRRLQRSRRNRVHERFEQSRGVFTDGETAETERELLSSGRIQPGGARSLVAK